MNKKSGHLFSPLAYLIIYFVVGLDMTGRTILARTIVKTFFTLFCIINLKPPSLDLRRRNTTFILFLLPFYSKIDDH